MKTTFKAFTELDECIDYLVSLGCMERELKIAKRCLENFYSARFRNSIVLYDPYRLLELK